MYVTVLKNFNYTKRINRGYSYKKTQLPYY